MARVTAARDGEDATAEGATTRVFRQAPAASAAARIVDCEIRRSRVLLI